MTSNSKKNVLLFSTLNPYPFWAGSENLWFDFVLDKRVCSSFTFHVVLADSTVTRSKAVQLQSAGARTSFYQHLNVSFARRNFFRISDKLKKKPTRTLPWYKEISKKSYDLVWFNVAALGDLAELLYAVDLCKKTNTPYWLILQHGYEDFFLTHGGELEAVKEVSTGAQRFIFISRRNRASLERALGEPLTNAFHSVNAITPAKMEQAAKLSADKPVNNTGKAKFFNLGRFGPRDKAQHLLLETFADAKWKERDWQLSFIGVSGFGKQYLEKHIRYYGLNTANIIIAEHTTEVFDAIVEQDVLLMPSMSEGTPFAMVESMACGRPAVGTPVGGIPELIRNGETGWLSRSVAVADISYKMEEAWSQRNDWQRIGKQAQEFVQKNYNQEHSFAELLRVLQKDTHS